MRKIISLIDDDFEDLELWYPILRAQEAGFAVDIAGDWLKEIIPIGLEILKINADELRVAFGIYDNNHMEIEKLRKQNNIGLLIITHGEKGSIAYAEEGVMRAVPGRVSSNFAVGSGDSYFAGLLYAVEKGEPLCESLKIATSCGLANTFHYGAGIMKREEIFGNLQKVIITELKDQVTIQSE